MMNNRHYLKIELFDKEAQKYYKDNDLYVLVSVGEYDEDDIDDTDIFFHYDTFEEILRNDALGFNVLEIDGTCITEFDLKKGA